MRGLLRNRWWIVAAGALGMTVGQGPITIFTLGVFLKPVTDDLGIDRGTFSSAIGLLTVAAAVVTPFVGRLVDRFGVRTVLLPMILLFALATMALSRLQPSLPVLYLLFGVQGVLSTCQTPTAYVKTISAWFDRTRGLALGIAQTGVGLGVALVPQLAAALIAGHGWRTAYVGLGGAILALALLPVALFLREPPAARWGVVASGAGVSLANAWRSGRFWQLNACFFLAVTAINGTLAHAVALLTDRGVPLEAATGAMSLAGIAVIVGRVIAGFCLDRLHGRHIAVASFCFPMLGIALLAFAREPAPLLVGAALCGLGVGAEVDLIAYFIGRYFGMRAYGAIYGLFFAVFTIGTGLGPFVMGLAFDRAHSYGPALAIFEAALLSASGLALRLGPYRYPAHAAAAHGAEYLRPAGDVASGTKEG
ncbi:MAG TPA: MFS transporter [Aliidongia sp.]|nr:MFS transporter [Aliidongia sp.]